MRVNLSVYRLCGKQVEVRYVGEERQKQREKTVVDIRMLDSVFISCFHSFILFLNKNAQK